VARRGAGGQIQRGRLGKAEEEKGKALKRRATDNAGIKRNQVQNKKMRGASQSTENGQKGPREGKVY